MGLIDNARNVIKTWLLGDRAMEMSPADRERLDRYSVYLDYQRGVHRRQIRPHPGQSDDNLTVNWCGLVIDRGISMMLGDGISFDLPGDDETAQDVLIQAIWSANRQTLLLHRAAQLGGTFGTGYLKIVPDGIDHKGQALPKLVALLPWTMRIETDPHDMDVAVRYTQLYNVGAGNAEEAHKIVTERNEAVAVRDDGKLYQTGDYADAWTETHFIATRETGMRWTELSVDTWPYPFAPIVHWQNLPDATSVYGLSDIEGVLPVQDRYNFNVGNISKIIRYHANPKTWVRGRIGNTQMSWGADEIIQLEGAGATAGEAPSIQNLEMQSDLASSREFTKDLREALFTSTRTTDPSVVRDQAGALTNFGLRVLFKDELHKTHTKRELYGAAILEVNHRLLMLANYAGEQAEPGEIIWPDPLPKSEQEQSDALTADLGNGLVSKQTASGERGYDWDLEQERMEAEAQAADDVGQAVLRAFGQGGGASVFPPNGQGANNGTETSSRIAG